MRFKEYDIAFFIFAKSGFGQRYVGQIVEVAHVGPWKAGTLFNGFRFAHDADYVIKTTEGAYGECKDYQLRKLSPPEEPLSIKRCRGNVFESLTEFAG